MNEWRHLWTAPWPILLFAKLCSIKKLNIVCNGLKSVLLSSLLKVDNFSPYHLSQTSLVPLWHVVQYLLTRSQVVNKKLHSFLADKCHCVYDSLHLILSNIERVRNYDTQNPELFQILRNWMSDKCQLHKFVVNHAT